MDTGDRYVQLLTDGISAVTELIRARRPGAPPEAVEGARGCWADAEAALRSAETPLGDFAQRLHLDTIEVQCILLALVRHVEPAQADGFDPDQLTVGRVVELLAEAPAEHQRVARVFRPDGTLIRSHLVTVQHNGASGLLGGLVSLTAPALRHLLGEQGLAPVVASFARLVHPRTSLLNVIADARHLETVRELVTHHPRYRGLIDRWGLDELLPYGRGLSLLISGPSGTGKTLLAHALGRIAGRPLLALSAADLPGGEGLDAALTDLVGEATIRDAIIVLDECEALLGRTDARRATVIRAIEDFEGLSILTTSHPEQLAESVDRLVAYEVRLEPPDALQRRQIWELHLPESMPVDGDVDLDALSDTYDFNGAAIKSAVLVAIHHALAESDEDPVVRMEHLVEGCRAQLGSALEELTVRTRVPLRLADIVLPDDARRKVGEIIAAIRNQVRVLNQWGFAERLVTGKGIAVLFDGPPGTGKTLCAEIIASELDRPMHRINIPEVVSKWVGETEKHKRAIFQLARVSQAMLLFDEADSLFSARSADVKGANDRYSNMEVNLLLQEIERFPGICILTTNFFGALDQALLRRIQFRVTFTEPDVAERARIWRTLCPSRLPVDPGVDFDRLADAFELTGGLIKNALLRAAYRAAEAGGSLTQELLAASCRDEYVAAGKVTRDTDGMTLPAGGDLGG